MIATSETKPVHEVQNWIEASRRSCFFKSITIASLASQDRRKASIVALFWSC
jgi:hypothetical protein